MPDGERPRWACLVAEHPARVQVYTYVDGRAAARPETWPVQRSLVSIAEVVGGAEPLFRSGRAPSAR